jgi:hypothetical protein
MKFTVFLRHGHNLCFIFAQKVNLFHNFLFLCSNNRFFINHALKFIYQPDHLKVNDLVNFRTKTGLKVTICWHGTPLVSVRYAQVLHRNLLPPFCTLKKESILLGYDAASLDERFPTLQSIIIFI